MSDPMSHLRHRKAPVTPDEQVHLEQWHHEHLQKANGSSTIYHLAVALRTLFEGPTVAELSQATLAYKASVGHTEIVAETMLQIRNMPAQEIEAMLQEERAGRSPA